MTGVLKKSQAEAIYNAMCALNNVNARLHAREVGYTDEGLSIHVRETETGMIQVGTGLSVDGAEETVLERHGTQHHFAVAYGLDV